MINKKVLALLVKEKDKLVGILAEVENFDGFCGKVLDELNHLLVY